MGRDCLRTGSPGGVLLAGQNIRELIMKEIDDTEN
jgi:hypothetical protein